MKPYSKDLRLKVLEAVDRGMPRREVAQIFGVSVPTIKRWLKRRRETGEVAAKPNPGPPARKGVALEQALPAQLDANPDFTLAKSTNSYSKRLTAFRSLRPASAGLLSGWVCHSKKDTLRFRARRGRARHLARAGRAHRPKAARFCGRMRNPYLHDSPLRPSSQRRASLRQCAP